MLDALFANYLLVANIILIVWLGSFVFYLYSSNQHHSLENELDNLNRLLDEDQSG